MGVNALSRVLDGELERLPWARDRKCQVVEVVIAGSGVRLKRSLICVTGPSRIRGLDRLGRDVPGFDLGACGAGRY